MLCERNDDVTYYALFIACIAACEKVSRHELAVALMQHALRERNLLAFWKRKSKSVGDWCNGKGIQSTSGMTATSQNASKVFSSDTMLHRCC